MSAGAESSAVRDALEESELLLNVYRAVVETADLKTGLRAALEKVCAYTGWVVGSAWLPTEDGASLSLHSSHHPADPELDEFIARCGERPFEPGVGLIGRTWQSARSEWSRNVSAESADAYPMAPTAARANLKAAFAVPLLNNNEVDGVLLFHAREAKERDAALLEVISRIASQIGLAFRHKRAEIDLAAREIFLLQNREILQRQVASRTVELSDANEMLEAELAMRERMETSLAERVRQQQAVADLGQRALGGMELTALMETVAELAVRVLHVEFCKVLELLPNGEVLLLRAGVGWQTGLVGSATVSAGLHSQAGYTLSCKHPVIVRDLRTEPRFSGPPLLQNHGIISGISVIIGSPERPYGVLGAHTTSPREFSSTDISFLQSIANVLSQTIDQQRAIEQTRRSAMWLERLITTTQDAVVSIDRRGCIVLFNPAAERVFGYSADEIVGHKVNELMAEPYATEHDDYISRYERTGEPRAIGRIRSVEGRRKSGEVFPIELSVTEVATEKTEDVHYAAFIRDISEARRQQAWLQSLIETTQDAVLSINRQGRIVLFNPAAEQIFGYRRDEVIGEKVNMLMAEPYSSEHDSYIARYESTGEARAIGQIRTVTARRKSGELFPIELSVTEIAFENDVRYAAFIRDISEKTRLEAQVIETERLAAIGTTASKIRHELANPLNGMSLTIQLMEQRLNRLAEPARNELKPTVKRLTDEIARLQKLLNEFGTISKREEYMFGLVDLTELIDDLVQLQAPFLKGKGIEFSVSMDGELPLVRADPDKMKQAILNLIKNAGEAMRGGGLIAINCGCGNNCIVLEISDSGEGIPLDIDAFQPFVTSKRDGTGLGLVIVRQIVTAHRGKISYRSTPGEGTTFRIELPQT